MDHYFVSHMYICMCTCRGQFVHGESCYVHFPHGKDIILLKYSGPQEWAYTRSLINFAIVKSTLYSPFCPMVLHFCLQVSLQELKWCPFSLCTGEWSAVEFASGVSQLLETKPTGTGMNTNTYSSLNFIQFQYWFTGSCFYNLHLSCSEESLALTSVRVYSSDHLSVLFQYSSTERDDTFFSAVAQLPVEALMSLPMVAPNPQTLEKDFERWMAFVTC